MKTVTTEILVMGSGLAGLAAAVTAAQKGAKVAVFEKRPFQGGGISNTPMMTLAVKDDPEYKNKAFKIHMNYTNWNANPAVVRTWIDNTCRIPGFIKNTLGIDFKFVLETPLEDMGVKRAYGGGFPNGFNIGDYYFLKERGKGHGAAIICKKAADKLVELGGELYFGWAIKSIIKEGDKVIGAIARNKEGEELRVEAKAIVIASGGFSDNAEMIKEYTGFTFTNINCDDGGNVLFNTFYNAQMDGEGQQAVWEIGGAKGSMGINGHNLVPGPGIIKKTPWLPFNEFRTVQEQPYLWVNNFGERFISEEMSNDHMAMGTAIANQPDKCSFLIFDELTKKHMEDVGLDYIYHIFPAKQLNNLTGQFEEAINVTKNRHVFMADTIEELCQQTGIDPVGLKETLENYNGYCEQGRDDQFAKNPAFLRPVKESKFYALRCFAGGYQAMGGIKINGKCEVLAENLRPILGLYAAGDCCAGEIYGNPPIGGIGVTTISFAQGFASADYACEYIEK